MRLSKIIVPYLSKIIVSLGIVIAILLSGCITIEDQPANCTATTNATPAVNLSIRYNQTNASDSIPPNASANASESQDIPLGPTSGPIKTISESNPAIAADRSAQPSPSGTGGAVDQSQVEKNSLLSRPGFRPQAKPIETSLDTGGWSENPRLGSSTSTIPEKNISSPAAGPFDTPSTTAVLIPSLQSGSQLSKPSQADSPQADSPISIQKTSSKTSSFSSLRGQSNDPFVNSEIYVYPVKRVVEGQKISFPDLNATDPDGDLLTYYFEPPLDEKGEWQTKRGDAGRYYTNISVSDGKNITIQTVILIVQPINRPPHIAYIKPIIVSEGQTVKIIPKVTDPDNDSVTVTLSGWKGRFPYVTNYNDAGDHIVIVTADDGWATATLNVNVSVRNVNRPPLLDPMKNVTITEGDLVELKPTASDPDGDKVTFRYTRPIDSDGRWQTKRGDAGSYPVIITYSDGYDPVKTMLTVTVLQAHDPPLILGAKDITVKEGETVTSRITASSPDNLNVTVYYSGWMDSPVKEVGYDEQGDHTVTVTASDGISKSKAIFSVHVLDVNRPPLFTPESFD